MVNMDLYKNAIVIKTKPKPVPKAETSDPKPDPNAKVSDPKVADPKPDPKADPKAGPKTPQQQQPQGTVAVPVPDIKLILEKERKLDDLLRQYKATEPPEGDDEKNVAVEFFMKMAKTYLALVLKFGDTVANTVIRMVLPAQLAEPIISDGPLDLGEFLKTADRVNQVLASPQFKTQLKSMIANTGQAVSPPIKILLNKMADILLDVAGQTGSKLASTAALSLSAFPPLAVVFDVANLISVGIKAVSSGINLVSTTANSGAKVVNAFNSVPKNIQFGGGFSGTQVYNYNGQTIMPIKIKNGAIQTYNILHDPPDKQKDKIEYSFNINNNENLNWQTSNIQLVPTTKSIAPEVSGATKPNKSIAPIIKSAPIKSAPTKSNAPPKSNPFSRNNLYEYTKSNEKLIIKPLTFGEDGRILTYDIINIPLKEHDTRHGIQSIMLYDQKVMIKLYATLVGNNEIDILRNQNEVLRKDNEVLRKDNEALSKENKELSDNQIEYIPNDEIELCKDDDEDANCGYSDYEK